MTSKLSEDSLKKRAGDLEEKCASKLGDYYDNAKQYGNEKEVKKIVKIAEDTNERLRKIIDTHQEKSWTIRSKYNPQNEMYKSKMSAANIARLNAEIRLYQALLNKMEKTLK